MKMRKMTAAALAAVLSAGTVSVAFAEEKPQTKSVDDNGTSYVDQFEIREEESKYEITLEKVIVNGEEKVAVKLSGLQNEILAHDYTQYKGTIETGNPDYPTHSHTLKFAWIAAAIDIGDDAIVFATQGGENPDFICFQAHTKPEPTYTHSIKTDYYNSINNVAANHFWDWPLPLSVKLTYYDLDVQNNENTFDLNAYIEPNDELIEKLSSYDNTTVLTLAYYIGEGSEIPINGDGGAIHYDEHAIDINSNGRISEISAEDNVCKERVKITYNLNAATESEPTTSNPTSKPSESTVTPGGTDPVSEPESGSDSSADKQTILDITLKNLDSENGLEGEKLDAALFGDSGWTWEQVEKIEFSSDDLFSVQFSTDNGGWRKLGEEVAARADDDNIWNTKWTLNASEMAKDKKYAKVIAKDGIIDVTAKVYIKSSAEKPSGENSGADQQPTGIALAIAPVVLAASAAIVVFKKKK